VQGIARRRISRPTIHIGPMAILMRIYVVHPTSQDSFWMVSKISNFFEPESVDAFPLDAKGAEWAGIFLESWLHVCQLVVDPDIDLNIVIQTQYVLLFLRCPGLQSKTTPIFPGCSHFTHSLGHCYFFDSQVYSPTRCLWPHIFLGIHWKTLEKPGARNCPASHRRWL
jgi:hypothetical protein